MGVHPTSGDEDGRSYSFPNHHSIPLMCDDIEAAKNLELPGAGPIMLYEPRHPQSYEL